MNLKDNEELVCGLNAVSQIIQTRPQSVQCLFVGQKPNGRIQSVMQKAEKSNITIDKETTSFFEDKFREQNHQNIAITCNKRSEEELKKLIELFKKEPFFRDKKLMEEDLREIAMKLKFEKC